MITELELMLQAEIIKLKTELEHYRLCIETDKEIAKRMWYEYEEYKMRTVTIGGQVSLTFPNWLDKEEEE